MSSGDGTKIGSSGTIFGSSSTRRTARGIQIRSYIPPAGLSSVRVERWSSEQPAPHSGGSHAHDFLQLLYVESGRHFVRIDDKKWVLDEGDAFVIAPGAVIATDHRERDSAEVWTIIFDADAIATSWRAHPLLSMFMLSSHSGGLRITVPAEVRSSWLARVDDLRTEVHNRRDWHGDAVRAHLVLTLVQLGRLGLDAPGSADADPLLAAVFEVIEARFHEPISLHDIASAVSQSSGYLTTVVGERTGRTVGQWITERRMREARRLLNDTDLPISDIAARVGYLDPGYFTRRFRAHHHVSPRAWRRAGR